MSGFIQRESEFEKIPSLLTSRVSGFEESTEYREMRDYELDIPGVVCGAFARYLSRVHTVEAVAENQPATEMAIASAHEAIETLASSPESAVRCLLTDEIFENLNSEPEVLERIRSRLKPKALALYRGRINEAGV